MKKFSILLTALCLIVVLALSVSAVNILGTQGEKEDGSVDWIKGQNSLIIYRTNGWTNGAVGFSYFGLDKPGALIKLPANGPTWQSMNLHNFDTLGTEYLMDMTNGFKVTVEDVEWDANSNVAIAITIGHDHDKNSDGTLLQGNNERTNLTCMGALTLVVRKDGTAALYNNKDGNWYGETDTHFDAAVLTAGATTFTYSMEKIEGGYKFYVNDTLLATFDASNAADWPADLTNHITELGFNFLGMNGTLAENKGTFPGALNYKVVAIDDMSEPEGGEDVPPLGDNVGAIVVLAAVAGGAILAFSKKKAH